MTLENEENQKAEWLRFSKCGQGGGSGRLRWFGHLEHKSVDDCVGVSGPVDYWVKHRWLDKKCRWLGRGVDNVWIGVYNVHWFAAWIIYTLQGLGKSV